MPIHYLSTAKGFKEYQRAVSALIDHYQIEQHLPRDFNLKVRVIHQEVPPTPNPAISIDLVNQELRVYPQLLLQNQAEKEVRGTLTALASSGQESLLTDQRLFALRFKSDIEKKLKSDPWRDADATKQEIDRAIETQFRQNVMGSLLFATLSPQDKYAVTRSIVHAVPENIFRNMLLEREGLCYLSEHALAQQLFNDAARRTLPFPPHSTQHVPVQIGTSMQFQSPELDAVVRRQGEDWFARTEKMEKITSPVREVEADVFATIRSSLSSKKLPVPARENPDLERSAKNSLIRALDTQKSQWIYPQETDGVYQGPIVFNEEGYIGQLLTSPDVVDANAGRGLLVLHQHANFGAESLPPVCPWMDVTVSYLDGQAVCLPTRRAYLYLEQSLFTALPQLQPMDVNRISVDGNLNKLHAMSSLHWAVVSHQGQAALGRWDQTPEPLRSQLLEQVKHEGERTLRRDLATCACANAARAPSVGFAALLQRWNNSNIQAQEAVQRSQIEDQQRHAFYGMQGSALENRQVIARQALVHAWQQTHVQELGRQEFFNQETAQRLGLDNLQAQARQVLQTSAVDAMQGVQRENLQQQEQADFKSLELNAKLAGAKQNLQAIESGQRREIALVQIAARMPIQDEMQTLKGLHLQKQHTALEKWHEDLSAQAKALTQQEQIFQLRQEQSQARLGITEQQQEERWDLRSKETAARQQTAFEAREYGLNQRERGLHLRENGLESARARVQEQREKLRGEYAKLNREREEIAQKDQQLDARKSAILPYELVVASFPMVAHGMHQSLSPGLGYGATGSGGQAIHAPYHRPPVHEEPPNSVASQAAYVVHRRLDAPCNAPLPGKDQDVRQYRSGEQQLGRQSMPPAVQDTPSVVPGNHEVFTHSPYDFFRPNGAATSSSSRIGAVRYQANQLSLGS